MDISNKRDQLLKFFREKDNIQHLRYNPSKSDYQKLYHIEKFLFGETPGRFLNATLGGNPVIKDNLLKGYWSSSSPRFLNHDETQNFIFDLNNCPQDKNQRQIWKIKHQALLSEQDKNHLWRLPDIFELTSLIAIAPRGMPQINPIFQDHEADYYHTLTKGDNTDRWYVCFSIGFADYWKRDLMSAKAIAFKGFDNE